ncbi:universal stress protein [Mangrovimonas aestuarii]|uniref:universal stress protein n=1 Tax=Mangrovimonas aestuarii TaxID=3018443 RepID=UPI002379940A|nr:universal stress protein [Mangrovimonas aestuarii]
MKKIIVPVDFSQHSEYALEAAAILAKQNNAEILALHMLEISEAVLTKSESASQAKAIYFLKVAEQRFDQFLDKPYLAGVTVTPIVKHFKVFSEVSEVADETNADLIVMGSHGASGLTELFIGSNTERVVRYSDIPVLVLKSKPNGFKMEHVVLASDFTDESVGAYQKASKMLDSIGAKLSLLYVNLPNDKFRSTNEVDSRITSFLKKADGNTDRLKDVHMVNDYTVEKGVLNFANKHGVDLIVVPTHGRTGIAHFFGGSISEDIANHAVLPVMTFKI